VQHTVLSVLRLKGTMSEFEISLLRQRAMEARRQKVGRGLVLTQVPVGYARTEDEGMEKTPDRQIQEAITGIFRKFASWAVCAKFCFGIATRNC
jgi:DNA invertase Pin-like site-specific DNA recombinase